MSIASVCDVQEEAGGKHSMSRAFKPRVCRKYHQLQLFFFWKILASRTLNPYAGSPQLDFFFYIGGEKKRKQKVLVNNSSTNFERAVSKTGICIALRPPEFLRCLVPLTGI